MQILYIERWYLIGDERSTRDQITIYRELLKDVGLSDELIFFSALILLLYRFTTSCLPVKSLIFDRRKNDFYLLPIVNIKSITASRTMPGYLKLESISLSSETILYNNGYPIVDWC